MAESAILTQGIEENTIWQKADLICGCLEIIVKNAS